MTDPGDALIDRLRAHARSLGDAATPIGPDEALARGRRPRRPLDRRAVLVLTAAFVGFVGSGAWLLVETDREDPPSVAPGPIPSTTGDVGTSTTQSSVLDLGVSFENLSDHGFVVEEHTGELTMFDLDGRDVGHGRPMSPTDGPAFVFTPMDELEPAPADPAEVPEGCASAAAGGGVRVALCGLDEHGRPRRVDVVGSDGEATLLVGAPPDPGAEVLGRWRWALVSPDGRWVLAQWSGECESSTAFVIAVDSGELRAVSGEVGDGWLSGPETRGLAWMDDGRALVEVQNSGCSPPTSAPGIYLLEPATGELELLLDHDDDRATAYAWSKQYGYPNDLERLLGRALDELGFDNCCGEPAHGSPTASMGVRFEGGELPISGGPIGYQTLVPRSAGERLPLLSGEAVVASSWLGSPSVYFNCGAHTWVVGWYGDQPAEVDTMLLVAEALVPHLACTVGEPPPSGAG